MRHSDWQRSNIEVSLLSAVTHTNVSPGHQHMSVKLEDGLSGYGGRAVLGVSKTTVLPTEVHHQPELPQRSYRAEERNEQVLVNVTWEPADKDLTSGTWNRAIPL